jgi:hypothetical protein
MKIKVKEPTPETEEKISEYELKRLISKKIKDSYEQGKREVIEEIEKEINKECQTHKICGNGVDGGNSVSERSEHVSGFHRGLFFIKEIIEKLKQ